MKTVYDLSKLDWKLNGYVPFIWSFEGVPSMSARSKSIDIPSIKAKVPGSVQASLLDAGVIEDWTYGDNARKCEWVENRHWIYWANIPNHWHLKDYRVKLTCLGLDYSGWIYLNGKEVASFKGTHIPHEFELSEHIEETGNTIQIIFDLPPRWLGQFGYTSKMMEWKTRFNYTWDWIPRLVQTGIWDDILLECSDGTEFKNFKCTTNVNLIDSSGIINIRTNVKGTQAKNVIFILTHNETVILKRNIDIAEIQKGIEIKDLPVELWWPNLEGLQPLYEITCQLVDDGNNIHDSVIKRVGFRNVQWKPCDNAPVGADPWICVVNGRSIFLQGFNFQPIRPNYADLTKADYEKRLKEYQKMGTNLLRINGCGFLEFEHFYELCDQMGIMVWQEFPLTSSGIENWPPEDEKSIFELNEIAKSYILRRQHHASLIMWSGGNELQGDLQGNKKGIGKPCDIHHPMLKKLGETVSQEDPLRRYIPTSPLGPLMGANNPDNFGKGLHWDVHGPDATFDDVKYDDMLQEHYWDNDDALFRSEIYAKGANPVSQIRKFKGEFQEMPASLENSYWCRPTAWWNDWELIVKMMGREPLDLEEYVEWSQKNQAEKLSYAMKRCKNRFPQMGGVLMWGSHETFPLPINSTVLDYEGDPKPAAYSIAKVWRK